MSTRTKSNQRRGAIIVTSRERYAEVAPAEPEHRERPMAEPVHLTREELAQQLAADPEFREWAQAERLGEMFGRPR